MRDAQDLTVLVRDTTSVLQISERDIADAADGLFLRTLDVSMHSGRHFVEPSEDRCAPLFFDVIAAAGFLR